MTSERLVLLAEGRARCCQPCKPKWPCSKNPHFQPYFRQREQRRGALVWRQNDAPTRRAHSLQILKFSHKLRMLNPDAVMAYYGVLDGFGTGE